MSDIVSRMRSLRDRLQGIPSRLGMPNIRESITIVKGNQNLTPTTDGLKEETVTTGIVKVGPPSNGKLIALANTGIQVDETMLEAELSTTHKALLNDSGLCRFYIDGVEYVPIHVEEKTLSIKVVLRRQYDGGWRPYG